MSVQVGKKVADFTAVSTGGEFKLSAFSGKTLVLYFYPKDNTSGCTTQAGDFRDHIKAFAKAGAIVVGVSRDSLRTHQGFKTKLDLPFELIADPDEALCLEFGVMKDKKMYGKPVRGIERSTFILDHAGKLVHEWRGVKVPGHVEEVLQFVQQL
jgi:thioredoxin-dependent peroxiredoxin